MTTATPRPAEHPIKAIVHIGCIAGTLDILSAIVHYAIKTGKSPLLLLQYIASKAFGPSAFASTGMAWWGLCFHYLIAFSWTTLFFFAWPRLRFLQKNKVITGLGYGIFVWLMMSLVVLPLSGSPFTSFTIQSFIGMLILMCMIGLPISWMTHNYYTTGKS